MKKAFGLIEVVIASGILALVLGASVSLSTTVLRGTTQAAEQTAAMHVASEGLEACRNIRDTNYRNSRPWDTGFADGTYIVRRDPVTRAWFFDSTSSQEPIVLNGISYQRTITISTDSQGRKVVDVSVAWANQTYKLTTLLTDSKP